MDIHRLPALVMYLSDAPFLPIRPYVVLCIHVYSYRCSMCNMTDLDQVDNLHVHILLLMLYP